MIGINFLLSVPVTDDGNKYILVISDFNTCSLEICVAVDMKATTVSKASPKK
jgi:hypothetical protein